MPYFIPINGVGMSTRGLLRLSIWQNGHKSVHFRGDPERLVQTMSITNARKDFLDLPDVIQDEPLYVTKHGRPVMTLLSVDQFEGMLETIEILSDQVFAKRLRKSIEQAKTGKLVSLDEAAIRLGL
jgi:prevent-host-death family protein